MRVRHELALTAALVPKLRDGTKRITIRLGTRHFTEEIRLGPCTVAVDSVIHCALADVPLQDWLDDGFTTFHQAWKLLRNGAHASQRPVTLESKVTVVRFHLL